MKRVLVFLITILVAVGCSVQYRGRTVHTSFLDFRPYVERGFFISPESYPGQYTSLGELSINVYPAILPKSKAPKREKKFEDGIYSNDTSSVYVESITSEELMELAYNKAHELGANGLSNFRSTAYFITTSDGSSYLDHYEVSGLCILIPE